MVTADVLSAIHAMFVVQQIYLFGGSRVCERCRQEMGQSAAAKRGMGTDYAPLVPPRESYDDAVETNVDVAGSSSTYKDNA